MLSSRQNKVVPENKSPKSLMIEIAEEAAMLPLLTANACKEKPIGYYYKRLTEREKQILKNLKSEDIQNIRIK